MNHREPPHLSVGARRVLHSLSLLLISALAPEGVFAQPRQRPTPGQSPDMQEVEQTPYLPYVGAPLLRFQEVAPPPDLVTRPAPAGPPTPTLSPTESSVAMENAAAPRSTASSLQPRPPEAPAPEAAVKPEAKAPPPAPVKSTPPAILPDDTHPPVRPEDFLPYFQIPGSATQPEDVNLLLPAPRTPPAPAPLPPSSATYTQSK